MSDIRNIRIGTAGTVDVDVSKFNDAVREAIFAYGLKQMLNDCRSQFSDPQEALAKVNAKLGAMYAGELRVASQRESDPVAREAKRIATQHVEAAIKRAGAEMDKAVRAAKIAELASREDVVKLAKASVAKVSAIDFAL